MPNWKNRFIAYVKSLDENITIDNAEVLIFDELARIKKDCVEENSKPEILNCTAENYNQSDKRMEMLDFIALYRELFYGRQDVFAVRWENEKAGTHGYAPKCKNEWDR